LPSLLQQNQNEEKATTTIAVTFFTATEPKEKGGSLRKGTYLQAFVLAYQF
jgi:hypothetical protein